MTTADLTITILGERTYINTQAGRLPRLSPIVLSPRTITAAHLALRRQAPDRGNRVAAILLSMLAGFLVAGPASQG